MVHPAAFLAFLAIKKGVAVTVYYSLKRYGFARAYRRLLEANKAVTPASSVKKVNLLVRNAFLAPGKLHDLFMDPDGKAFYSKAMAWMTANGQQSLLSSVALGLSSVLGRGAVAQFADVLAKVASDSDRTKKS